MIALKSKKYSSTFLLCYKNKNWLLFPLNSCNVNNTFTLSPTFIIVRLTFKSILRFFFLFFIYFFLWLLSLFFILASTIFFCYNVMKLFFFWNILSSLLSKRKKRIPTMFKSERREMGIRFCDACDMRITVCVC